MNISTLSSTAERKKKVASSSTSSSQPPHPLFFQDMNYNHGFPPPGGPGPGGYYSHPYPGGPYPPPHPMQQGGYYDPYGNPMPPPYPYPQDGSGYPGYPPYPQHPGEYPPPDQTQEQFIRRDPRAGDPPGSSTGGARAPEERLLRNPHPHIPTNSTREETYDPSLPTYNATPIYQPHPLPGTQKTQIIAPTLSSIFEIAQERVSRKKEAEQQQQQQRQEETRHHESRGVGGSSRDPATPTVSSASNLSAQMAAMQQQVLVGGSNGGGSTEIITGLVTQMQDHFGMVSGEIFFQTSTVVGRMPELGDKVVVEAERVSGMPFKFNGKRVQLLSKDLLDHDRPSGGGPPTQEEESRGESNELFERRGGASDFGPLPSMPQSLNLGGGGGGSSSSWTPPPLKSILKRNPPPPPIISKPHPQQQQSRASSAALYRPESPSPVADHAGFTTRSHTHVAQDGTSSETISSLFSLDLRSGFPIIKPPRVLSSNVKPLIPIHDLYPELLFVKNIPQGQSSSRRSMSRSLSPKRSKKTSGRRSRSKSPPRRARRSKSRSRTPPRGSRGHRGRSTSPRRRDKRSKSRSPGRSSHKGSGSRTARARSTSRGRGDRDRRRRPKSRSRSRSPPGMKKSQTTSRPRRKDSKEDDDIQILEERRTSPGQGQGEEDPGFRNPFGSESEIKAEVGVSTLFPRIKKKDDDEEVIGGKKGRFSGQSSSDFRPPLTSSTFKNGPPPGGIKFQIPPLMGVAPSHQKFVPNPLAPVASTSAKILQNPAYTPNAPIPHQPHPSTLVASVAKAVKGGGTETKKKKGTGGELVQKPAFVIKDQNSGGGKVKGTSTGGQNGGLESKEQEQLRRIAELKESLHAQKLAQIQEKERYLLDQKKALEMELSLSKGPNKGPLSAGGGGGTEEQINAAQLQRSVSDKLKGLRQNWDQKQGGIEPHPSQGTSSFVGEEDKIQEAIHYQKFLDEERRLKLSGDGQGLSRLYEREERRRRKVEEDRLEGLRLEEMRLKKVKDWGALKKLVDSFGGTAAREMELLRLREMRMKEEMVEEEAKAKREEEEAKDRAELQWREEEDFRGRMRERSLRGEEPPVRRLVMDTQIRQLAAAEIVIPGHSRGSRRPHEEMSPSPGDPPRSRSREKSRSQRSRSKDRRRSPERHRRERRSRSRSRSPGRRRRSRSRSRGRIEDREQVILAQMEAMRRQEEELLVREREIHARMERMSQHAVAAQQQQHPPQEYLHPEPPPHHFQHQPHPQEFHQQPGGEYFDPNYGPPHHHLHPNGGGEYHQGPPFDPRGGGGGDMMENVRSVDPYL